MYKRQVFAVSSAPFNLDVPKITVATPRPDGSFVLGWSGTSDGVYIEFTPALVPSQWQTLAGPITGSGWTNAPQAAPAGFYRLRLQ